MGLTRPGALSRVGYVMSLGAQLMETGLAYGVSVIKQTLPNLLPTYDSPQARLFLTAAGYQETKFLTRKQYEDGPARGFWQMEMPTGVALTLRNRASSAQAALLCKARGVPAIPSAVWHALETDDILACGMARLYLYCDPYKLPEIGDEESAKQCYLRVWRPGKFRPDDWPESYREAMGAFGG